ncbi:MAG: cell division topological specificity factor MinE [Deltaproteobacteria bacterium]|nr:cell division topological specificity factor MinE [Deltaproteobacteria bacterium]
MGAISVFLALKEKLFGGRDGASKSVARSRLHFVLVQDRTGLTNEEMASFKSEMIGVIERYFVIDKSGFDISYKRDVETTTLLINSPVVVRKRSDEKGSRLSDKFRRNKSKREEAAAKSDKQSEGETSGESAVEGEKPAPAAI